MAAQDFARPQKEYLRGLGLLSVNIMAYNVNFRDEARRLLGSFNLIKCHPPFINAEQLAMAASHGDLNDRADFATLIGT